MDDFSDVRFTENDIWVREENGVLVAGITDYAQHRLGDIISVEIPEPDDHHYNEGDELGMIESLSGAMELFAPVAGVIVESNLNLLSSPELIVHEPFGKGWIFKIKPDDQQAFESLMDVHEYESTVPEEDD